MAVGEGIIKNHNSSLLECNGGHIVLTKTWAKSILDRLGYVKRQASSKAKYRCLIPNVQSSIVFDIKTIIEMEEIPKELVINWDHTGIP